MLHALPVSFLIWSWEQYLVRSTEHEAPRYVVFFIPLLLVSLGPKYSPQHPILEHLACICITKFQMHAGAGLVNESKFRVKTVLNLLDLVDVT
jgi:hypothetical protein